MATTDGRMLKGEQTRRAILGKAMNIASAEGLDALSIGRLATELGMSKSGLFTHFGSKEELQLATIRAATKVFVDLIVAPSREVPPGLDRVKVLLDHWLDYARGRTFPGGCFFYSVAPEFDSRPGRVRDAIADNRLNWRSHLEDELAAAAAQGEIAPDVDVRQLAFEIDAVCWTSNNYALLHDEEDAYIRAYRSALGRLDAARSR